jgi:hypothetical protein
MMYCLRSFIPLLLLPLPLSLSPIHLTTLLILTYALNRPCIYCSLLLVILFASSCHWSGRCFWSPYSPSTSVVYDSSIHSNDTSLDAVALPPGWDWLPYFLPRLYTTPSSALLSDSHNITNSPDLASFFLDITNTTFSTLVSAAASSAASSSSSILDNLASKVGVSSSVREVAKSISIPSSAAAGGIGTQWLKTLWGGRGEWTLPCVGVKVVL